MRKQGMLISFVCFALAFALGGNEASAERGRGGGGMRAGGVRAGGVRAGGMRAGGVRGGVVGPRGAAGHRGGVVVGPRGGVAAGRGGVAVGPRGAVGGRAGVVRGPRGNVVGGRGGFATGGAMRNHLGIRPSARPGFRPGFGPGRPGFRPGFNGGFRRGYIAGWHGYNAPALRGHLNRYWGGYRYRPYSAYAYQSWRCRWWPTTFYPWAIASGVALSGWIGATWYDAATYASPVIYYDNGYAPAEAYAQTVPVVNNLIDAGVADPVGPQGTTLTDADWMAIGVFGLMPPGSKEVTATIQLASTKDGRVRGYYTDTNNKVFEVVGTIDRQTLRVVWQLTGSPNGLKFETSVDDITKEASLVNVYDTQAGKVETWQMIRQQAEQATAPQN